MNIVLVAEESAGIQLVKALARTGERIVAVMTSLDAAQQMPRVAAVARGIGLEVWPAHRVSEPQLADDLRARQIDLLLNVHSLHVIPDAVVNATSIGAFNLHPGPLPRYAGLNCPSWAIYRGERVYGVTVHRMTSRIDAGAIAYQTSFAIDDEETGFTLSAKCIRAGVPLMLQLVEAARQNPAAIPEVAQDVSERQYFGREIPRDGALVWSRAAREVVAFIRAADYYPFPSPWRHPRARYAGCEIGIVKAARTGIGSRETPGTLRRSASGGVEVATADEWVALDLVFVGGRYLKAGEALEAGACLEDGEASTGPAALDTSRDRM